MRPTTMAPSGMVVSPHYLATQTGLSILKNGGNAVEAAIATAAAVSVVYPHMNSIGGDNFWLIYNANKGDLKGLNASGRSGARATIEFYKTLGLNKIPSRGYLAANTVPGAVSGWQNAFAYSQSELKGTLGWADLLHEAIGYAENGYPVTPSQEYWTTVNLDVNSDMRALDRFSGYRHTFLQKDGSLFKTGDLFTQKELANTLRILADNGADEFYQGAIARRIVAELKANEGLLTLADFKQHKAEWVNPISVSYRDYLAYNLPPNTQGLASLSILNILNNFDLKSLGEGSTGYYHLIIEATKQAFADRDKWLTDPDFVKIPVEELLSQEHGAKLAARIDNKAAADVKPLDPKGDTIWLGVVDKFGNAVSLIQSIYHDFGSGIVIADTGITLQNRGSFFSLDPAHVNRLDPMKRTFHTLNPAMLFKNNSPYLVYGTMGGEGQPQTQAALVTRIVDFNFEVQHAIEAPRLLYGRSWGAPSNDIKIEGRVADKTIKELTERGHHLQIIDDFSDIMGHAGAILINTDTNIKFGGADPRGDGYALGY